MNYNYQHNQESQKQALIGIIMGLTQELHQLAPHPDCPNYKGPMFVGNSPYFKVADDRDGMIGSMILEGVVSMAFAEAVSDTMNSFAPGMDFSNIDITNVMEGYSDYITDVENRKKADAHGQGTMARMSGKSISNGFNMRAKLSAAMDAFYKDLPKRMNIERNMAYYAKQLDDLENNYRYQYNTPQPSMAA